MSKIAGVAQTPGYPKQVDPSSWTVDRPDSSSQMKVVDPTAAVAGPARSH